MVSDIIKSPGKFLALLLFAIAIHSSLVGLALILQPRSLMELAQFGHNNEPFFPAQNGVFHIALALGYAMAGINIYRCHYLILYTILVKSLATVFLFIYYLAVDPKWIILVSGIGDGLMALAVYLAFLRFRNHPDRMISKTIKG